MQRPSMAIKYRDPIQEIRQRCNYDLSPKISWRSHLWIDEEIPEYRKKHGWLRVHLRKIDDMCWRRWEYRDLIESNIVKHSEIQIPSIKLGETPYTNSVCINLIKILDCISLEQWDATNKGWVYFEYLCDWFLWAFGHPSYKSEPLEPSGCEGAKHRIGSAARAIVSQMVANPFDYLGEILHDSNLCRGEPFFSLPRHESIEAGMSESFEQFQNKSIRFPIPVLGSGRQMLHLSNYFLNICGQDIHPTLLKICQVQAYLYAPWVAEPIRAIQDSHQDFFWKTSLAGYIMTCNNIESFSGHYNLEENKFEVNYTDWSNYSPFCIVKQKFNIEMLDPSILNTGILCKKL